MQYRLPHLTTYESDLQCLSFLKEFVQEVEVSLSYQFMLSIFPIFTDINLSLFVWLFFFVQDWMSKHEPLSDWEWLWSREGGDVAAELAKKYPLVEPGQLLRAVDVNTYNPAVNLCISSHIMYILYFSIGTHKLRANF
jgi:hypothetical protein